MENIYRGLPINSGEQEFRLITILPSSSLDSKLRCHLRKVSLRQSRTSEPDLRVPQAIASSEAFQTPKDRTERQKAIFPSSVAEHRFLWGDFAALSYVWGKTLNKEPIEVNGVDTEVTSNLAEALICLRRTDRFTGDFGIWIDALCINQADNKERGQQVAMMRKYYSTAWSVVAFLGPAYEHSEKAIALIRDIADMSREKATAVAEEMLRPDGCSQLLCESWLALSKFFLRPYWSRLWIMQELALSAGGTVLYCGFDEIRWDTLCRALALIHVPLWMAKYTPIEQECLRTSDDLKLREVDDALYHVQRDLWMLSAACESHNTIRTFGRLIEIASYSESSDPRDRVYGMLGVMHSETVALLHPDYKLSPAEVFISVIDADLAAVGNLEFLRAANLWGRSDLPSWVPDWTWTGRLRDSRPDDPGNANEKKDEPIVLMERRSYSAGRGVHSDPPRRIGRVLHCTAALVDEVDGLGTNNVIQVNRPAVVQSQYTHSAYGDFETTAEHLHTTLFADRRRFFGQSRSLLSLPLDLQQARATFEERGWTSFLDRFRFYHRWVDWCKCNEDFRVGGVALRHYLNGSIPPDAGEDDYLSAYGAWTRTAIAGKRRLFTTAAGRFGWISCATGVESADGLEARRGDVLAVFPGCSMPILLRKIDKTDRFRVFGEAYVHGMMEGEIHSMLERGEMCLREIDLE